jgi:hypothetical protein
MAPVDRGVMMYGREGQHGIEAAWRWGGEWVRARCAGESGVAAPRDTLISCREEQATSDALS